MAEEKHTVEAARPTGKRPAGKRESAGAPATTKSKPVRTKDTNELSTRNPLTFLKQVVEELRKVIWPTGRQMVTYTLVVLLFLAFMIALVWGVDTLAGLGIRSVFQK